MPRNPGYVGARVAMFALYDKRAKSIVPILFPDSGAADDWIMKRPVEVQDEYERFPIETLLGPTCSHPGCGGRRDSIVCYVCQD